MMPPSVCKSKSPTIAHDGSQSRDLEASSGSLPTDPLRCFPPMRLSLARRYRRNPRRFVPRTHANGRPGKSLHQTRDRVRTLDHLRRRTRALDGLCDLRARRAEPRHHARADHGPRRGPKRRPLLRDGHRRRRFSPARSTTRSSSRRASSPGPTSRRRTKSCGPNGGDSWRSGGMSPTQSDASRRSTSSTRSFASSPTRRTFPTSRKIVVAGHSAGGQFATRYEMANKVHDTLGVAITYVVANPSSYAWPAAVRPLPTGDADPATADKEALGPTARRCTRSSRTARSTRRRRRTTTSGPPGSRIAPATRRA